MELSNNTVKTEYQIMMNDDGIPSVFLDKSQLVFKDIKMMKVVFEGDNLKLLLPSSSIEFRDIPHIYQSALNIYKACDVVIKDAGSKLFPVSIIRKRVYIY